VLRVSANSSSYFSGLDEELVDNDALLRILDVIGGVERRFHTALRAVWRWLPACFGTTNTTICGRSTD
jgi:hypothetical protein